MGDPYITFGPDPGGDPEVRCLTADQLSLGRLRRQESDRLTDEWVLTAAGPAFFAPVALQADDQEDAEQKAIAWLDKHLRIERRDLFHEDD
jgi:hypothetical protein